MRIPQICQYRHNYVSPDIYCDPMSDYDAIIVGAGHNGLTAAAVLQRAGLKTLILEANTYAGGMAATVELIDGFRYEIAGSVQFPTPSDITKDLGLDTLPTVDADVMSVNIGEAGEEAMIFYRDPMELMTHLSEKHGTEAVMGMAELIAWSQGPARALGRFDVRQPPKTIDEMYACATNESERRAIHETLFGSAMDVIDRYLPNKEKHAVMRGMLAFLAINSTYRGPYTPGSATCLAFALAVPEEGGQMMTKLEGGIGALTEHLRDVREPRRRDPLPHQGRTDPRRREQDHRRPSREWRNHHRTRRRLQPVPRHHPHRTRWRRSPLDRADCATARTRPPRLLRPDALRAGRPTRIHPTVRVPQRARYAAVRRHLRLSRRAATAVGERLPRRRPRQPVAGHADPFGARQPCLRGVHLRPCPSSWSRCWAHILVALLPTSICDLGSISGIRRHRLSLRSVYGHANRARATGTKIAGEQASRKGLSPLVMTIST